MASTRRSFLQALAQGSLGAAAWSLMPPADAKKSGWPPSAAAREDDFWGMVREQFPLTDERAYLNAGGLCPAPYPVLDTMSRTRQRLQTWVEAAHDLIEAARNPVADFFNVKPSEIALLRNTTEGNSTVASGLVAGLEMEPGDEVIFESHAHPGGSVVWLNWQKQRGIEPRIFDPDPTSAEGNLQRIRELITPRTRVIQVSHVTAPTGIRFPAREIARLAHEHDCWFHVDGAQTAGMFPVDLRAMGCDSYATSGHKWMCAPHGTGVLYVQEDRLDEVVPTEVGSFSASEYHLPDRFEYNPTARRYQPGTRDAASVAGLVAAVEFLEQIGMERVEARGRQLCDRLREGLQQIEGVTILTPSDPALRGSMVTFKTEAVPYEELYHFFAAERSLRCRIVRERGLNAIRVSPHIYNALDECDQVVEATRAAIERA